MRRILSLRIPHFHTTVEALFDSRLRGQPLLVVSGSYGKGMVVDASPEAAAQGAAAGMSYRHARRCCPDAVLLEYDRERYAPVVEQLGNLLYRYAPWVEFFPGAENELFADLGRGSAEDGLEMARRIQAQLAEELGLSARVGLAAGKLCARALTADGGGSPEAASPGEATPPPGPVPPLSTLPPPSIVPEGRERRFLAPLPVEMLWDLKPEAVRKLHLLGLRTLGQLAALPPRALMVPLGPAGVWYGRLARGLDRRPVAEWNPAPAEIAACFVEAEAPDRALLEALLGRLAERIAGRLLRAGRYGRTVSLTCHLTGGRRLFAVRRLKEPTHLASTLFRSARALLDTHCAAFQDSPPVQASILWARPHWALRHDCDPETAVPPRKQVEVLELAVSGLETRGSVQLSIFGDEDRAFALRAALAGIQERFGERAVATGSGLPD